MSCLNLPAEYYFRKIPDRNFNFLPKSANTRFFYRVYGTDHESSTEYDYYDDKTTDGGAYGKLKSSVEKHGSITIGWSKYEYDTEGRTTKVVSPFGNAAFGSADNACRVTEYSYTPVVTGDTAGDNDHRVRRVIQKVLGTEISRSYTGYTSSGTKSIRAASAGAAWDATGNLTTTTEAYDTGTYKGRTKKITHPNNTITVYTYSTSGDNLTTTVYNGAGSGTTVTDGTKTVTVTDGRGNPSSVKTYDVTSSTETLIGDVDYQTRDDWGRELVVEYLDGTKTITAYGCCGPSSFTNREGTTTTTVYNTLKQIDYTETPHPSSGTIKTYYSYDVFGNVKTIIRKGTDNSEISISNSYNSAGELISTTDPMGNTTTYKEGYNANGQRVSTITYPNRTTNITTINMDGTAASISGTAVNGMTYNYAISGNELVTTATPAIATQWVKSYTDFLGRNYKTEYADGKTNITYYNSLGQVEKTKNPSNIYSRYSYNSKGEVEKSAVVANSTTINDTTDQVTKYEKSMDTRDSLNVITTITKQNIDGSFSEVSKSETSTNGLTFWSSSFGRETKSTTSFDSPADGTRTVVITNPDSSTITNVYENGLLTTSTHSIIGETSYAYDAHIRLLSISHTVGGTVQKREYSYNNNNQVTSVKRYAGTTLLTTKSFSYDNMGRRTLTTLPDGRKINYQYSAKGELTTESGAEIYPKTYSYDNAGNKTGLTTFKSYPSSSENTSFTYSGTRGFLTGKTYADNTQTTFTHEDDGRLKTRVWNRNLTTTYGYDSFGNRNSISYSDSPTTTNISFSNTSYPISRAKSISVTDVSGTRNVVYKTNRSVDEEPFPLVTAHKIDYGYDSKNRLTDIDLKDASATHVSHDYTYTANSSNIATVSDGNNTITYHSRVSGSNFNNVTKYNNGSSDILEEDRDYDSRNRLTKITYNVSSTTVAEFTYVYNDLDQRTKCTLADGSYWQYTYDSLGQVTSAKKYTSSGTPINGHQYSYSYDSIGNRIQSTSNEATSTYTTDEVNQYTSRTVPGKIAIAGSVDSDAKVAIEDSDNSVIKAIMQGSYFSQIYIFDNSESSAEETFKIYAHKTGTFDIQEISVFIPKTPETRTYDTDGNLLSDGKQSYTWNGENRLIKVEKTGDYKEEYKYDYMGRRIEKKIKNWTGTAWQLDTTEKYAWAGWQLIGIFNASDTLQRSYCWGENGRLISDTDEVNNKEYFPIYDANHNITGYIDSSDGTFVAKYEFDAFGKIISKSGAKADEFLFRFASYQHDKTTGMIYYGLRYYNPESGRFINFDPIGFDGGVNLYANSRNDMINGWDYLGTKEYVGWKYFPSIYYYGAYHQIFNEETRKKMDPPLLKPGDTLNFETDHDKASVDEILILAGFVELGFRKEEFIEAADHFHYWIYGKTKKGGTNPPQLSEEFLKKYLKEDLDEIREYAAKLCQDEKRKRNSFKTQKVPKNPTPKAIQARRRAYYVLGEYDIFTTINKETRNNKYCVKIKFEFEDEYNFHEDKTAGIQSEGINVIISDKIWLRLHKISNKKYGHDFMRKTTWEEILDCCDTKQTLPKPKTNQVNTTKGISGWKR